MVHTINLMQFLFLPCQQQNVSYKHNKYTGACTSVRIQEISRASIVDDFEVFILTLKTLSLNLLLEMKNGIRMTCYHNSATTQCFHACEAYYWLGYDKHPVYIAKTTASDSQ